MSNFTYVKSIQDVEDYYFNKYIRNHKIFEQELNVEKTKALLFNISYFYNESFNFIVKFIQNQMERESANVVSDHWVEKLTKHNPEMIRKAISESTNEDFDFDRYIPKLSLLAICNQLLFLSDKDPYIFVTCWNFVFRKGWNFDKLRLLGNNTSSVLTVHLEELIRAIDSEDTPLNHIKSDIYETFDYYSKMQKSIKLLAETFEMFYQDIVNHDENFIVNQNKKLQLYFDVK